MRRIFQTKYYENSRLCSDIIELPIYCIVIFFEKVWFLSNDQNKINGIKGYLYAEFQSFVQNCNMQRRRNRTRRIIQESKNSISTTLPSPPRHKGRQSSMISSSKVLPSIQHCISNKNHRYSTIQDSHSFFSQYLHRKQAVIHKRPSTFQNQSFDFNTITPKYFKVLPMSVERKPKTQRKREPESALLHFIDSYFAKKLKGNVQEKIISKVLKGQLRGTQEGAKWLGESVGQIVISSLGN